MYEMLVILADTNALYQLGDVTEQEARKTRADVVSVLNQFGDACRMFDEPGDDNVVFDEAMDRLRIRGEAEGEFKMTIEKIEGGGYEMR